MTRAFLRTTLPLLATLAFGGCFEETPVGTQVPVFCGRASTSVCPAGTRASDLDADGCADRCEAPTCETFAPVDCGGATPVDLDGDGCARECPPSGGASCGGLIGAACAAGEYCDYALDAACGAADQTGTCQPRPEVCTELYAPVCGCDGKTYPNECAAHAAAVSVAAWGACGSSTGQSCGGLRPPSDPGTCDAGFFCSYERAATCGYADATGVCAKIPDACPDVYTPVCGCDGKTYGNECEANAAGTSVLHGGACDVVCPAYYPNCGAGQVPADTNDDGCIDGCAPAI